MTTATVETITNLDVNNFLRISAYIQQHYGIQLPLTKRKMVEARLQQRVKKLNVDGFSQYLDFVFSSSGREEYFRMIDLLTTNKTEFFREPAHFDFLSREILPSFSRSDNNKMFRVWSAACSSGEEVYSTMIAIEEYLSQARSHFQYQLLGTDVSVRILKRAVAAVYDEEKINHLPLPVKKRYFLKSKDRQHPRARLKSEFSSNISFKRINLLKDLNGMNETFDVIFCRNVLIYFDRNTQQDVIRRLLSTLRKGGYFFIGHSESLTNMDLPLKPIRPTIYQAI